MKKTFIVFAIAPKFLSETAVRVVDQPMIVSADDADEAILLAGTSMAERLPGIPVGTELHCYDIETEAVYVGSVDEPVEETKDETDDESNDEDQDGSNYCSCPRKLTCDCYNDRTMECNLKCNDNQAVESPTGRCTHPVENPDSEQQTEERVYRADELVFAVTLYPAFEQTDVEFIVDIAPAEMWEHGIDGSYGIGGYNVDNAALRSAGINTEELMEGQFEVLEGATEHDVIANMIEAGFRYSQSFIDYIKAQRAEEQSEE